MSLPAVSVPSRPAASSSTKHIVGDIRIPKFTSVDVIHRDGSEIFERCDESNTAFSTKLSPTDAFLRSGSLDALRRIQSSMPGTSIENGGCWWKLLLKLKSTYPTKFKFTYPTKVKFKATYPTSNAKSLACDTANEHALTCTRETCSCSQTAVQWNQWR